MEREVYLQPDLEVLEVPVELGFAASAVDGGVEGFRPGGLEWIDGGWRRPVRGCCAPARPTDRGECRAAACRAHRGIEASAPATRTELASDGYNVQWSPGDRIGVYVESGGSFTTVNAPMTSRERRPRRAEPSTASYPGRRGLVLYAYAYYPYDPSQSSSDATGIAFTLPPQQTQRAAGDSTHLGDSDFWSPRPSVRRMRPSRP